jgi:hypothetical protein
MTMDAPMITMFNGVPGSIRDTTIRPFVIGLVPVVGAYPVYPVMPHFEPAPPPVLISPLSQKMERLQYEAARPDAAPRGAAAGPGGAVKADAASAVIVARESSAARGDVSLAEIRGHQAAADAAAEREIEQLIAAAQQAELGGLKGLARVRYQQAAAKVTGERRRQLLAEVERLKKE